MKGSTVELDRDSAAPLWRQIELALTREIQAGTLPPGARLPNETDVAARFGVHRHTARRALATLADKGAVRIRRGLGTFVEHGLIDYHLSERTRFTANLLAQNRLASHDLLGAVDEAASEMVAEALALPLGALVTRLDTLGRSDGAPVSIAATSFPAARFPGLAAAYAERRSVTAVLAAYGVPDYLRRSTRVLAVLPTQREATLLRQSRRAPVLSVESVDTDAAGVPISFSRVRFAGERVQFVVG